jgi:hypothetical protein
MHQPANSDNFLREGITPLEWRVVVLATRDADCGAWQEPRFPRLRRLFDALTGWQGVQRLADERLEKLRLFICMKRRGDRRAETLALALVAMGFQPTTLQRLELMVGR